MGAAVAAVGPASPSSIPLRHGEGASRSAEAAASSSNPTGFALVTSTAAPVREGSAAVPLLLLMLGDVAPTLRSENDAEEEAENDADDDITGAPDEFALRADRETAAGGAAAALVNTGEGDVALPVACP